MLSPQLRRKVHELWTLFWTAGLSNPLVAIEQITFLLFIRQLEALDNERVKQGKPSIYEYTDEERKKAKSKGKGVSSGGASHIGTQPHNWGPKSFPLPYDNCKWSYISQNPSFRLLNETVFPWLRTLERRVGPAQNGNTTLGRISGRLNDAYFILDVNKTETLKRAVSLIDELFRQLDTRSVNSDIMGDIFEYLLEEVKESGKNGQFRTPRHVIRFMVQLLKPELGKKILDPACGSGGFLLNTLMEWKADHTDDEVLRLEWDGTPHDAKPVWPRGRKPDFNKSLHGYDNDRTMVRIAWMNLILHDLDSPEVHQLDALSKRLENDESGTYDYILANPPFTGSVDEGDLSENRERFPRAGRASKPITTKSELLFVWLMLDLLKIGGRAAVIVPDGVLSGSTNAHRELRRQLLFQNTLEAVVSLPGNLFQPYSAVKTSILLFQKAQTAEEKVVRGDDPRTQEVWFYEINDESFSLDQKRKALHGQDNDFWDALEKAEAWQAYRDGDASARDRSVASDYHQPDYWEERWRSVDDEFLQIFPEKAGEKGHTWALHELWPKEFLFSISDPSGARQYDEALLVRLRPKFENAFRKLVEQTAAYTYASARQSDETKALTAAEKKVKALANALIKAAREENLLDREFDQFGLNGLKTLLKEMTAGIREWTSPIKPPYKKPKKAPPEPGVEVALSSLIPLLKEFAKLDGYNVWRRGVKNKSRSGKLTTGDEGEARQPTVLSWIVAVRRWAEREGWTDEEGDKRSTHKKGIVDPDYLVWLRDDLKIFDHDGTVKERYRDRLTSDCLEALDFNLSAGRHKPFVFDAGQHRPPADLIGELQAIHGEVQKRLATLLAIVGGVK